MLVLTRRLNGSIVIPALGITIRVSAIKGNTVRIGIDAPPDVAVYREEVLAQAGTRKKADEACLVGSAREQPARHRGSESQDGASRPRKAGRA